MMKTNAKRKNSAMKKLIPAAGMLALSASMLATSTYAWFSMNKDVTVTGMSVSVQSDSTFLLVKQGTATAAQVQSSKLTQDNAITATATLYPTAHDSITPASTGITAIEAADTTDSNVKDIWYYRYSSDPADKVGTSPSTATYVPVTDFSNYVLVNEFSLATADGSNELENLRVKSCTLTTSGDSAVKVLVAGANGCQEFDASTAADISATSQVLQTANVTDDAVSTVKVYLYWDGNDTDVYTNNVDDLLSTAVQVIFTGDIVPAGGGGGGA
jgi:hypothetical protein